MRFFRRELSALVIILAALALLAASRSRESVASQTPERLFPRVAVDGVSLGDSPEVVKRVWGELVEPPRRDGEILEPVRQPEPRGIELLGRRYSRVRGSCVTVVQGQSLTIDGRTVVHVGDNMEKVRGLFGEPEPDIVLTRGCGNAGPATRWSYRRHGVILSFVVPNQDYWRDDLEEQIKAHPEAKVSFEDIVRREPLLHEVQGISIHLRELE